VHLSAGTCSSPDEVSGWVGNSVDWQSSGNEPLPMAMREISRTTWRHCSPALDNAPVPLGRSLQHVLGNHGLHGRVQRVPPGRSPRYSWNMACCSCASQTQTPRTQSQSFSVSHDWAVASGSRHAPGNSHRPSWIRPSNGDLLLGTVPMWTAS
jgi:hypothetical protein